MILFSMHCHGEINGEFITYLIKDITMVILRNFRQYFDLRKPF
jgi:hypothetical protein